MGENPTNSMITPVADPAKGKDQKTSGKIDDDAAPAPASAASSSLLRWCFPKNNLKVFPQHYSEVAAGQVMWTSRWHRLRQMSAFTVWRISFYTLMAYNWSRLIHGPFNNPWLDSMSYDHMEWLYTAAVVPKTEAAAQQLMGIGILVALSATVSNPATVVFTLFIGQHVGTNVVQFVNHYYLFFLLSALTSIYCHLPMTTRSVSSDDPDRQFQQQQQQQQRYGWLQALRGQIIVVYAYASLWKCDRDWIDGTICEHIFLQFESNGEHRGVPWSDLVIHYPNVFVIVAWGGLVLDTTLCGILLFVPPKHPLLFLGLLFHGFTGYTMSLHIGYSFPVAMILSILLFQPMATTETTAPIITTTTTTSSTDELDTICHARWFWFQLMGDDRGVDDTARSKNTTSSSSNNGTLSDDADSTTDRNDSKEHCIRQNIIPATIAETIVTTPPLPRRRRRQHQRQILPLLWLLLQWCLPLRMPVVSHGEYKYNFEGNRWSWTMMLHGKTSIHSDGLTFMTVRPECNGTPFPNPEASQQPYMDIHTFPYERHVFPPKILAFLMAFHRQLPKLYYQIHQNFPLGAMCRTNGGMQMKASFFSSTNSGPYHRIIDPTIDLLETYRAHAKLSSLSKFWFAIIDKAPSGYEFVLRGLGSIHNPSNTTSTTKIGKVGNILNEITFVDRSTCLQADPIRIHSNSFSIQFDTNSDVFFRLLIRSCPQLNLQNCHEMYLEKGETQHIPSSRTVTIGIDPRRDLPTPSCSKTVQEDVIIRLTQIMKGHKSTIKDNQQYTRHFSTQQ